MTSLFELDKDQSKVVLRIMNGPLCGCEYYLDEGVTLVLAGAASDLIAMPETNDGNLAVDLPDFPDHTIVVPVKGGVNFEIMIDGDVLGGFRLRTLAPHPEESRRQYQEICFAGTLAFAVRPIEDDWDAVLLGALQKTAPTANYRQLSGLKRMLLAMVGLFALFPLIAIGLSAWDNYISNTRVDEVAAVVAGSTEHYQLLNGGGGAIFLFAQNERDLSWARQAVSRRGLSGAVRMTTLQQEENRINKLLLEEFPSIVFHRIKLSDPKRPVLLLSQERGKLTNLTREALLASLAKWMPYATKIDISNWSDATLDTYARTGLDRLGIAYERVVNTDSVTYKIKNDLNDIDLMRLQEFTNVFYRDFGTHYVYFSAVLQDDPFKGKSYKYGFPSYIKKTQNHWFFPGNF